MNLTVPGAVSALEAAFSGLLAADRPVGTRVHSRRGRTLAAMCGDVSFSCTVLLDAADLTSYPLGDGLRAAVEDAGGVDLPGQARAEGEARRVRGVPGREPRTIRGEGMGVPPSPGRSPRWAPTSGSGRPVAASRVADQQQLVDFQL